MPAEAPVISAVPLVAVLIFRLLYPPTTIGPLQPAPPGALENRASDRSAFPLRQQAARSYAAPVASAGVHSVPQPRPGRYISSLVCCVNSTARRSLRSPSVST